MSERTERELDAALRGSPSADEEANSLARLAGDLQTSFEATPPTAARERAVFVQSVSARRARGPGILRLAIPAMSLVVLGILVGFMGRQAFPGDALYPVREALLQVGLATPPAQLVDARIASAGRALARARALVGDRPRAASRLALGAIADLDGARRRLDELSRAQRPGRRARITALERSASGLIARVTVPEAFASPSPTPSAAASPESDDSAGGRDGPEASDDSGGDDSSGSGSGDDSSGSGSGHDSSGSGSGHD